MTAVGVETVREPTADVLSYLQSNVVRNVLDIWSLTHERGRYELTVCRTGNEVKAHLGVYDAPEAKYTNLGGEIEAAETLLPFIPDKTVLTIPPDLGKLVSSKVTHGAVYQEDFMVVERGQERLDNPESATRLMPADAAEYSTFGSSFNVEETSQEWARDRLENNAIFGVFCDSRLVSMASLAAWLPKMAVILGVETKKEFRKRGFGRSAVSAAVREALVRSEACSLFVRSDNHEAIRLYRALGFRKVGDELWIDIGTGIIP